MISPRVAQSIKEAAQEPKPAPKKKTSARKPTPKPTSTTTPDSDAFTRATSYRPPGL